MREERGSQEDGHPRGAEGRRRVGGRWAPGCRPRTGARWARRRRPGPRSTRRHTVGLLTALLLLGTPLTVSVLGPPLAGGTAPAAAPSQPPGDGHPLGTDVLGRDVLSLVLHGGGSVTGMAVAALLLACAVGVPLGLLASGGGRLADEAVMRVLDLLLAFPPLLALMAMAATGNREWWWLVLVTGLLQAPPVARLVRGAALAPACRTVVEALRMQGRGWLHVNLRYVVRSVSGPLATDAGARFGTVLYLLASANFLGLGLSSASPDWAVLIERNGSALFTQPWAVLVPAALLMSLCAGASLAVDAVLGSRRDLESGARPTAAAEGAR